MAEARQAEKDAQSVRVATPSASFARGQRRVLESIIAGVPVADTLGLIVQTVEGESEGLLASILILEGNELHHGAAPSLDGPYCDAIHRLVIGEGVGSCGTAAATGTPVVVEDVQTHPYWVPFRELAARHRLRACWSTPIFGRAGGCIGTFAIYHREPHKPTAHEAALVAEATHLAGLAIEHDRLLRAEIKRQVETAQRAQLREFFKNAPIPIAVLLGPDPVFDFVNPAYEKLINRTGVEGKPAREVFPELKDQGIIELLASIYRTGVPYSDPQLHVAFDRGAGIEDTYFNVRLDPYRDAQGAVLGVVVVAMETTEQVRARHEADSLRADLGQREKLSALGQLVSGVAHEIRTPLTYLANNLNLIQMRLDRLAPRLSPTDAEAAKMLSEQYVPSALEAADRINHLVEDLRSFTQKRAASREKVSFHQVTSQAIDLFRATHRGHVHIDHVVTGDAIVEMDKLQVQQAILNLLQNAMESSPRDHTIRVRTEASWEEATISVADTGRGIPPDAQQRIFDPFFTTRQGGTGLGLSIVKRIADDHGGSIGFKTGPEGTTFHLRLRPVPAVPR